LERRRDDSHRVGQEAAYMKFGARQRWAVLITMLTAALSAAAWVRDGDKAADAQVVEAPVRQARAASGTPMRTEQVEERVHLEKLHVRATAQRADDAFAPRSWRKTATKAQAAANAAVIAQPPSAPPLPFVYMGKLLSEDAHAVFLTLGERNLIVHEGDVIDAIYRVDKLSDAGLTFIHLPSGIQQNLPIGEPQ
jgi:hypothetical protein